MDLNATKFFVKIVKAGSISAASRELNLPKATLSRQLAGLEQKIGERLINRTTRGLSLTDLGREYYENVVSLIEELESVEHRLLNDHVEPSGLIRIGATSGYCQYIITPLLPKFLAAHPKVRLELKLSERREHIIQDGLDLTIRMGSLDDSDLLCRKIADVKRVMCASPSYLSARGVPKHPEDLKQHECVVLSSSPDKWHFEDSTSVAVNWRIAAGNMTNACELVLAGSGIGLLADFMITEHMAKGRLTEVLVDFPVCSSQVNVLYANNKARTAAAMAFVDFLITELRQPEH